MKIKPELRFFDLGNGLVHVYDPTTSKHFKLGQEEAAWVKLVDGTRSQEELRGSIPLEVVDLFFANLARLEILDSSRKKEKLDIFKLKLPLFSASRFLNGMGQWAVVYQKFLTITFPILLLGNILLLAGLSPRMTDGIRSLHLGINLPILYLVSILAMGLIHEMSHAIVAQSYGVNTPVIGMMFFYFHPAFFADISGINILQDTKAKINILLAGIMGNNLLVSLALLTYLLFPASAMSPYLLIFASLNVIIMLVNLIPFIEFDGHYILLELFGDRSFAVNARALPSRRALPRLEQAVYLIFSSVFMISTVLLAVTGLRNAVFWYFKYGFLNYIFLALMVISLYKVVRRILFGVAH